MRTFFTSDTHFGHNKILEFCKARGVLWPTVEEHDEGLIDNWNSVVSPNDTVFHLGDFAFAGRERIDEILDRLNGKIILIRGNHDKFKTIKNANFNAIFESVIHRMGKQRISMSHTPETVAFPAKTSFGLCGHIHEWWKMVDNGELLWYDRRTDPWTEIKTKIPAPIINVGVDQWNFRPVEFAELQVLIQRGN